MDGERYGEPLNDASLDREIESLLASDPSPEFVARVRTRVAEEPEPRRWRAPWMLAITAGAVTAVVVGMIAWPVGEPVVPSPEPTQTAQVAVIERAVPPVVSELPPLRSRTAAPTAKVIASVPAPDRRIDIDLPEVVLADNEVKTFATLVASVRQSRFDVAVPAAPDPNTPLEIKELPPVEPLEIEPIVKVAALQAEGERP
jgi:hypothetical protein